MFQTLQIGRAIAALAVCAFHLSTVFADSRFGLQKVFDNYTRLGYLGVDFFFALSGFIILYAHAKDIGVQSNLASYAAKRFGRIYPLYWVITSVVLLGAAVSGGKNRFPANPWDALSTIALVHFTNYEPPIAAAWTLYSEIFFYCLFGVVIARPRLGGAVMVGWASCIVLFGGGGYLPSNVWFVQMVCAPVNFCFFGGMGAFLVYRKFSRSGAIFATLFGFILLAITLWGQQLWAASIYFKLSLACAFLMVLSGLAALEGLGLRIGFKPLVILGNSSFAIYLTHESVQSFMLKVALATGVAARLDNRLLYGVIFLICVCVGLLVNAVVERPLLALWRSLMRGIFLPHRIQERARASR